MGNKLTQENASEYPCPNKECENDYLGLAINSSRELGVSEITCSECGYSFQDECHEEELISRFNRKYKA